MKKKQNNMLYRDSKAVEQVAGITLQVSVYDKFKDKTWETI